MDTWIQSIKNGNTTQICRHMTNYNFNQQYRFDDEDIYPLFYLYQRKHFDPLETLIENQNVDVNVLDKHRMNLLYLLTNWGYGCKSKQRLSIIKKLLDRSDFNLYQSPYTLFGFVLNTPRDTNNFCCAEIMISHPRVDVNHTESTYANATKTHIGQLLSNQLDGVHQAEILNLLRRLLSRNDVRVEQITKPHHLLIPYLKFYHMKKHILEKKRSKLLIKPVMWNAWQKISYKLQTPPLTQQELSKLRDYAKLIGYVDPNATPIMMCVKLSEHFEKYKNTLTYNHHLPLVNDCDLFDNLFSEMPVEYIIQDDANYGFNIAEISELLKLKRHPYTGKDWAQITIRGTPFLEYFKNNAVNPIHLMHQMNVAVDEPEVSNDDQCIQRLMEYYSYLTHPICQIYAEHSRCRHELLKSIGFPSEENITFSEFVEDLIGHLISFPAENRGTVRQQVYRYFEFCQIYV
jgi:hypothetical protein